MDDGLRRYKELLDYHSLRTIEIYIQVSKKLLSKIKNPTNDFFE